MSRLALLAAGSLLILLARPLHAAEEDDLIAIVRSEAGATKKWAACQRLRTIGTAACVPAVAPMLLDERLSQAARHVLEGLPGPEAGAALREALGKATALVQAGIIDSIGWRKEPESVQPLKGLLSTSDKDVAASAAAALGRIGGRAAADALMAANQEASITLKPVLEESLLKCAEGMLADNDNDSAAGIYRRLTQPQSPVQVRIAAWRGLVLADPGVRRDLIVKALSSPDRPIQVAAQKVIRELRDREVVRAALNIWASLPVDAQISVLDAHVQFGEEALPTVRLAGQSPDVVLRTAAWQAAGELNDLTAVPALARAAAGGDAAERDVARDTLGRLRGPAAREALLSHLAHGTPGEQAELLRAFGERGDRQVVDALLRHAADGPPEARLAALESVRRLAPPQAVSSLLDIAAKAKAENEREAVLKALYAICEASPEKEQAARSIIAALGRFAAPEKRQVLPLLAELGTPDALGAAEAAIRSPDPELAREAARVLARWPNAAPAGPLLDLARSSSDPTLQTLAVRGAIEVVGQEPNAAKRLALLQRAFETAQRSDEKKQALGQVGQVHTRPALDLALKYLSDPDLGNEAALAAVSIAEKLAESDPKLGDDVAGKLLEQVKDGDAARRAWALRLKPSSGESFIREWLVSGPFRKPGINGAQAVFSIAFAPEQSGQKVEWRAMRPADFANLAALFPGAENCVAYLRTKIVAPEACNGALLMGSDDGIKAWLNGQVVHEKNADRPQVIDQDIAPIKLKKGTNELMLKVSQGGGGWSACARVVGTDGKPIPGLLVERPMAR